MLGTKGISAPDIIDRKNGAESIMSSLKQKNTSGSKPDVMKMVATGIVNARFAIIAVFALVCVYCILSVGKVKVNNDLTDNYFLETSLRFPEIEEDEPALHPMCNEYT